MSKFRVKLRVSGYVYVTVEGKDEDDAMCTAKEIVNDNIEDYVGRSAEISAEVSDYYEIGVAQRAE